VVLAVSGENIHMFTGQAKRAVVSTAGLCNWYNPAASITIKSFVDVSESACHLMFPILVFMALLP
jgi:hypothetical protein